MKALRRPDGGERIHEGMYVVCDGLHPSPKPLASVKIETYQNALLAEATATYSCEDCADRKSRVLGAINNHVVVTVVGKVKKKDVQ